MEPTADLRADLAPLFRHEPARPSVATLVAGGRRRLRRRRLGQGAATVLVVVALATGYAAMSGGVDGDAAPVSPPSGSPTATVDLEEISEKFQLVLVDKYGNAEVQPGVEVLQRIENPLGLLPPYTSTGLEVRNDKYHIVVVTLPGGTGQEDADKSTLQELVDARRSGTMLSYSESGPMPLNIWQWGEDGRPVFDPGIKVLRTVENPLGVAPPRESVAYVIRGGAHTWWALWEVGHSGLNGAETSIMSGGLFASIDDWLSDQEPRVQW